MGANEKLVDVGRSIYEQGHDGRQPVRTIADNTKAKAPKTIGEYASKKVREAKLAAGHAKRRGRAAGTAAKTHVTRNKAAYIAGGAGLAAGAVGGAVFARRKKTQNQD